MSTFTNRRFFVGTCSVALAVVYAVALFDLRTVSAAADFNASDGISNCRPEQSNRKVFNAREGIPNCPALDQGKRFELCPFFDKVNFKKIDEEKDLNDPRFISAVVTAQNIVAFYENASEYMKFRKPAYGGISRLDGLSLGQMQWNWNKGKGTLVQEFFRNISPDLLNQSSDEKLQKQLLKIFSYATDPNKEKHRQGAQDVINDWHGYTKEENSSLKAWLVSEPVREYQDNLIKQRFRNSLILAKTWMSERNYSDEHFEKTLILFANLNIHTGLRPEQQGLRGVWVPQVNEFLSTFNGNTSKLVNYILDWMRSCQKIKDVTGKEDAFGWSNGQNGNIDKWSDSQFINTLSKEQIELLAYAFLYATRSDTNDEKRRINGYSQLDVLNRAATIVLNKGTVRGRNFEWNLFRRKE